MLRTLGITGLGPRGENRIIFYSILFILILTILYVISFYGEEEDAKKQEKEEERSSLFMADNCRSINFSTSVELSKSF